MRNLLILSAVIGLVGCVGGIDTPTGDDQQGDDDGSGTVNKEGKAIFDRDIYPIIAGPNGVGGKCIGCHNATAPAGNTTGFVDPVASRGYETITGFVAVVGDYSETGARMLTIVVNDKHKNLSYSPDEQTKIKGWLAKELSERAGGGGTTPPPGSESPGAASERLVKEWSGCMSLTNFQTANMAQAWGRMTAQNNQECDNCHATGGYGFIASRQEALFFSAITENKYFMLHYFKPDLTAGTAAAKMVVNTTSFEGVANGEDPHREHPRFNATDNQGMTALQQFYTLTMDRKTAGTCDPPRLTN